MVRQKLGRPNGPIHGVTSAEATSPFGQEVGLSGPLGDLPAPIYQRTWTKAQLCLQLAGDFGAAHFTSLSFSFICKTVLVIPMFGGLQESTCSN